MRNGSRPSAPRADTQHVPVDHHRTIESAARDDRPGRSIARGVASCLDLRLEADAGRLPDQRVVLLLDRDADVFIAGEAQADGWLVKPLDARRLNRAVRTVLSGDFFTEGPEATTG